MDRIESCREFVVYRPITVKLNPAWPKYQMVCGEITRIRSSSETPECLIGKKWYPCEVAA